MNQPLFARADRGLRRAVLPLLLLAAGACNERPSDAREWRPTDHDHTENPGNDQVQVDPQDAGAPTLPGLEDVTIVAWQQNCTPCHGQLGRGDGPRGPMLKATDLSNPKWQGSVSDEQIGATIKQGRGLMPAFKLPDVTIANLVKLVRMMDLARLQAHAEAAASAAPSASGVPASSSKAAPKPSSSAASRTVSSAPPTPSAKPSAN